MHKHPTGETPSCSVLVWLFHYWKQLWIKSNSYWHNWIYVSAFSGTTMLAKTFHTSNWPDIAGRVLHLMSPQIYLPQAFLPMVMVGFFFFVLDVCVLSQVHNMPRCSLTGQCVHLSIWAGLSTPSSCASPGLKTQSPLCYSLGQWLVEHFCKEV